MDKTSKFVLLVVVALHIQTIECNLYGSWIRQYFKNLYASPYYQDHSVNRRNIPDFPGSAVIQEPSSRDLDVGFAVGVKDEGEASDVLINNHSSKTYSPAPFVEQQSPASYFAQEPSSKELNIGVYVDPKNGVRYYTPGLSPTPNTEDVNSRPLLYGPIYPLSNQQPLIRYPQLQPLSPYPARLQPISSYPAFVPANNYLGPPAIPNEIQPPLRYPELQPLSPYPAQLLPANPYSAIAPANNYLGPPAVANEIPYPYQTDPSIISYPEPLYPAPTFQRTPMNSFNTNPTWNQYPPYQYQNNYKQTLDIDSFPSSPYTTKNFQYQQLHGPDNLQLLSSTTFGDRVYPFNYQGRYPRSHGRFPQGFSDLRNRVPSNSFQNVFQINEQVPSGSYGHFTQPVIVRQLPQSPEIVVNQQGTPIMSSQPYGERQVGAFKLRNDHGYQVTMNVPPLPATDGPEDGVLVMEMKANLYRPMN